MNAEKILEKNIKFTKEMKAYFRHIIAYTTEPKRAAEYLYDLFADARFVRGNWSCLYNSKAYKDLEATFKWCDAYYGGNSRVSFNHELRELMVAYNSLDDWERRDDE